MFKVKVKFQVSFKDGTISPDTFRAGSVHVLDEVVVRRIQQSGGELEILEKLVPNPQKAVKDED